jgi:uncharacterized protein with HEPN domain
MLPEIFKYLYDIIEAGQAIASFVKDKTYNDYTNDLMMRSAAERQLEIIGEALNNIIKIDPTIKNSITDTRKIINFRNILIHAYSIVSNEVVWGVLEHDLPRLMLEIQTIYEKNKENLL